MKKNQLVILLVVLALVGLAWVVGRPAYHQRQERQWLQTAKTFVASKDYRAASLSLARLLHRHPSHVEAIRLGVQIAELTNGPDLLAWRRRLAEAEPKPENKLALASTSLRVETAPYPTAQQILTELEPAAEGRADFHVVAAERALRLNKFQDAESHLQSAARLEPANRQHKLNLAVLRLESRDQSIATAARNTLDQFRADPELGSSALRSLVAHAVAQNDLAGGLRLSQELLSRQDATFADRVQNLTLVQSVRKGELAQALAAAQQAAGADRVRVAELATWMNSHGLAAEAIKWLKTLPAEQIESPPGAVAMAQACLLQKDWRTLLKILKTQDWGTQEYLRFAMLAWASQAEGDEGMKNSYWKRALLAATEPEVVPVLVNAAQGWGWTIEAEQLLWETARKYPRLSWPLDTLERAYFRAGDTKGLLRVYAAVLERKPEDPIAKNDLASVSLLLNTNLTRARALALEAYTQSPTNPLTAATFAFSLYSQGKLKEALEILGKFGDQQLRQPSMAGTYALLLKAAGEEDRAKTYQLLAQRGRLLPEERKLLGQ